MSAVWDLTNRGTIGNPQNIAARMFVWKKGFKSDIFDDLGLPPLQLLVNGTHIFSL